MRKYSANYNNKEFVSITENMVSIECLSGIFTDETDRIQVERLIEQANAAPALLEALEEVASWAETVYDFQDDDDSKDLFLTVGTIRKAAVLIEQVKGGAE